MKNKIIIFGLAGTLAFSSISFASEGVENKIKERNTVVTETVVEDGIIIESKTILVDFKGADTKVEIPVIKGLSDIKYQDELNQFMKSHTEKEIEEFKVNAKSGMEASKELKPVLWIDYEVKSNGDTLSFVINSYTYLGGANGISRKNYYNINTKENKTLELKDLFKENEDYKSLINAEINKQIKEQILDETKIYFEGDDGFKSIKDNQNFYVDKNGNLVIAFDKYEIAPGYMGHPEFKILKEGKILNFNNVKINGKELELEHPIFESKKGNIMLPMAEIMRALDFKVEWNGKDRVVNINKGAVFTGAYINEGTYYFSKALVHLEEGAQLIEGTTFIPMSFIDQVLKGEKFVDENGVLNINL